MSITRKVDKKIPVLVDDMQISPPPLKGATFFWSKKLRNVLKRMKNQFSDIWFLSYGRSKFFELCAIFFRPKICAMF